MTGRQAGTWEWVPWGQEAEPFESLRGRPRQGGPWSKQSNAWGLLSPRVASPGC